MNENNNSNFNNFNVGDNGNTIGNEPIVYDSYYNQKPQKSPWGTIIILILGIVIILIVLWKYGIFTPVDKQAKYINLSTRICNAATTYADSNFSDAKEISGKVMYVKISTLSNADLIEANLFDDVKEKPIPPTTDVRLEVLPNGDFQCHGLFDPKKDRKKPVITLKGESIIYVGVGATAYDPGFTAYDEVDGDISENVKVSGSVPAAKRGTYKVNYVVQDRAGNLSEVVQRTYIVQ
ncbi:MAG: DUF5011 domain-containing protein [Bacilli bacterium]|nr:DUF5011 domain-containing protein [Bacilli bacterium]MDD3305165.1 DUF5011 domain-containing protein [Bacilli bacterium]MDD4053990.1 DUF5011 domain-containing protein [Bacilli bacterium]MDD4411729.1 DUF5011 domain-containing protein [Bacilli bacterium]